jgi:magnesium transporter
MIRLFATGAPAEPQTIRALTAAEAAHALWIDLEAPDADERAAVEAVLGFDLPSRSDMVEIEASSRVYRERGASYMTAVLAVGFDGGGEPAAEPVSFILKPGGPLVTVRYCDPHAFRSARERAAREGLGGTDAPHVLLLLIDLIIDRTADILEQMAARIDETARSIFGIDALAQRQRLSPEALESLLRDIGRIQFAINKVHDSLQTLSRITSFLNIAAANGAPALVANRENREALRWAGRDITSLTENATFLMQNIFFLLDAAVGRISIEQNVIIKILSVFSVIFMPPTLIAGVYGMNFSHMPELASPYGYAGALVAMAAAAILPYWWFRRNGWL